MIKGLERQFPRTTSGQVHQTAKAQTRPRRAAARVKRAPARSISRPAAGPPAHVVARAESESTEGLTGVRRFQSSDQGTNTPEKDQGSKGEKSGGQDKRVDIASGVTRRTDCELWVLRVEVLPRRISEIAQASVCATYF